VAPLLELPARVDEEDGVVLLVHPEEEKRRGDAYAVEEVGGEPDHAVEEVLLDEAAANDGLAPAPEEDAVGDDDADAPRDRVRGFDHVADEGVVAPALWRHAPMEAAVGIAL